MSGRILSLITLLALLIPGCSKSPVVKDTQPFETKSVPSELSNKKPENQTVTGSVIVSHPDQLVFKPLDMTIPKPERITLGNKIILYLLADRELPLVNIIARFKIGAVYDPLEKPGLTNLTATLIRSGGTAVRSSEELDEALENMAASLEVSVEHEEVDFQMSLLKQDLAQGLALLEEVLTKPIFDNKKIEFEKSQLLEELRRENDNPDAIKSREFRKLVYPIHPYGRPVNGNPVSITSITRENLTQFHQKFFTPDNLFIGVSGDFEKDKLLELLNKTFGAKNAAGPSAPLPVLPKLERRYTKSVNLVSKKIVQSSLIAGHIGVARTSPDYFPLMLMNGILGNGAHSRLYQQLREKEGLVYSVWSYFAMPKDLGMFAVETKTKNQTVTKAIGLIQNELKKIREEPVKDEELQNTKDTIINQFVFKFSRPEQIISSYIYIELLGLPDDYFETYCNNVSMVTKEDIQRVAREYLRPDDLIYLVVGDESSFDQPLSEFGPVNRIELEK
ncbi:MAG: pitrilysin family protein [Planctomycetota bacterium]